MFGFFKKNHQECPVNNETREWIEDSFFWLRNTFGDEEIKNRKVLLPNREDFPIQFIGTIESANSALKIVAAQMELQPENIVLDIYSEGKTEIGADGAPGKRIFLQHVEGQKYSGGQYLGMQSDQKHHIALEEKTLRDPIETISTLAYVLVHIKLFEEKKMVSNNKPLTDLTTIVFGLGVFNANAAYQRKSSVDSWGWSTLGSLSQMEWGYALALFATLREEAQPEWLNFLNENIQSDFKKSMRFIQNNPDLIYVVKEKAEEKTEPHDAVIKIIDGQAYKLVEEVFQTYDEFLKVNANDKVALNNAGYKLLRQTEYNVAIAFFKKAIDVDDKFDFAFNNLGYCELQIGYMEDALININKACEMNPFNSFAWRNLGIYYFKNKEFEKALTHFEEAERINPETELINYYIGKTHENLGDSAMAKQYFIKSSDVNECLDSPDLAAE